MTSPDRRLADVLPQPGALALVVGLGLSGKVVAGFLARHGVRLRVCDRRTEAELAAEIGELPPNAELRLGGYGPEVLEGVSAVFTSPGVPWRSALLEAARARGLPISSEVDLFFRLCPAAIVGITGTNGKTTTTALTGAVLARGERPVMVGGNIGETVLDRLPELTDRHWAVLELSSFQLESISEPHVHVATVLNVTPDHLDWHGSFEAYAAAKARLVQFLQPADFALLNSLDEVSSSFAERTRGQVVWFDRHTPVPPRVRLPGRHNLENALAAAAAGRVAGVPDDGIAEAIAEFAGVEHRLELVGAWDGVRWYNDSKATNPDAARVGLAAFPEEPVVLIAGGYGSGFELEPWLSEAVARAEAIVLMGASAGELESKLSGRHPQVVRVATLEEAVAAADSRARPGAVVLLSPGYKSYDMFRNFEERGRRFKAAVRALKSAGPTP